MNIFKLIIPGALLSVSCFSYGAQNPTKLSSLPRSCLSEEDKVITDIWQIPNPGFKPNEFFDLPINEQFEYLKDIMTELGIPEFVKKLYPKRVSSCIATTFPRPYPENLESELENAVWKGLQEFISERKIELTFEEFKESIENVAKLWERPVRYDSSDDSSDDDDESGKASCNTINRCGSLDNLLQMRCKPEIKIGHEKHYYDDPSYHETLLRWFEDYIYDTLEELDRSH